MVTRRIRLHVLPIACICVLAATAHADEFHLKDGSKITGTIVGYENGSFKVETSYGFALVRKDTIAEILTTEKKTPADPDQGSPGIKSAVLSGPAPKLNPAVLPMPAPRMKPASMSATRSAINVNSTAPAIAVEDSPAPVLNTPGTEATPAASAGPQAMEEVVRGNLYINRTYGFQIYKPPTWELIRNAQNQLPNAVGALGTNDQSTLLVIGRDPPTNSIQAQAAATERTLRGIYQNFRPLGTNQITVAGAPAIEERFYGKLGDQDWSVTVTTIAHENQAFTILGMTSANSDLIQIQENVIAKTIASLKFVPH